MSRPWKAGFMWAGFLALMSAVVGVGAETPPPAWLLEAARLPTPALPAGAPAVVLLDETTVTLDSDGRLATERHFALRILSRSGRDRARASVSFLEKRDKVRSSDAWVVRAGKAVRPNGKRDWSDLTAAASGAVFDEHRQLAVDYSDFALVGDVFGFATRVEGRPLFAQFGYGWGSDLPQLAERYVVQLPSGWTLTPTPSGPRVSAVQAVAGPPRWSWEINDTPFRPTEPFETENARLDVRLGLSLVPPAGTPELAGPMFKTWAEVAGWNHRLDDPQCDTDAGLSATMRRLTAGCGDELGRIRALCGYVQKLRYVAVNRDIASGMGYRPRKATIVHAQGWGDCKDKANLLRALLREAGIESYPASANLGGGRSVDPAWPSAMQFNHAILAIRVSDAVALPAVVATPRFGRLLFFDATHPDVLPGDLPWPLQGGKVHVIAPGSDELTALPVLPADPCHLLDRRVGIELRPDGAVAGECTLRGSGGAGAYFRGIVRRDSAKELRDWATARIGAAARGAGVAEVTTRDDPATGEFRIGFGFTAANFAQLMPGGLALVRLDLLNRDTAPSFTEKERRLPVGLSPLRLIDETLLRLPAGFVVDELPEPAELRSPFGTYRRVCEKVPEGVKANSVLEVHAGEYPISEYAALRQFFSDVLKAERAAVVLRRAAPGG